MTGFQSHDRSLDAAIAAEWDRCVPDAVEIAARDIAARYGDTVEGVLFYGSCLRTGEYEDRILDFYVLVQGYRLAYGSGALALANALIPPNVFYHEIDVDGVTVRSKYAVLSLADFQTRTSSRCLNVSIWARFCQPCLLMLPRSEKAASRIRAAVTEAACTMLKHAWPLVGERASSSDLWITAFSNTYRAELRSEKGDKGREIYMLDQARYDSLTPRILHRLGLDAEAGGKVQPPRGGRTRARLSWLIRRVDGKTQSILRLIKASMTFDGGMDYLAWKISRHSGVSVDIKPWMRRMPLIGAPYLAISLRLKGAFR